MDNDVTVSQLRESVRSFVNARKWEKNHSPKRLAVSIAVEAAELLRHFQWLTDQESQDYLHDPDSYAEVSDELADIMIYCLAFANNASIDISTAAQNKSAKNELRFPIDSC